MLTVRPRTEADLAGCVCLLRSVHETDGYPVHFPEGPEAFLEVPDLLGAWVALDGGDLVGHVLLRRAANPKMMALASQATGLAEADLAVVGRLFVAPTARRIGAGRALLAAAVEQAWAIGRRPVLDVLSQRSGAATALYEREGWHNAGTVPLTFRSGETVDELVYVGPEVPGAQRGPG